ncbi:MAG: hypothetical protein D6772_02195 [Bacteroidetes bacterium]|nr:MAG: hypothetical protein D6772_02195 [Bacteroidota bacterium]
MRILHLLSFCALAFILMAATCRPFGTKDISKLKPRIEMEKGPCFGSCPVFKLTIYEGGVAVYEGRRFTDRIGRYTKQLDMNVYRNLIRAFQEANMWSFQNAYKAQVPDLPTVTITYHEDGNSKSVKGKDGRPEKIEELEAMLDKIANSGGWEGADGSTNHGLPDHVIAEELIVNLSPQVDPSVWVIQFAKQDMRIVKRISPNSPYWVFRYNPDRVQPNEMLELVRRDPYVLSAEFNTRVAGEPRQ